MSDSDSDSDFENDPVFAEIFKAEREKRMNELDMVKKLDISEIERDMYKNVETFLSQSNVEYAVIGGRAFMAYVNLNKVPKEDLMYLESEDYDLAIVGNERLMDKFMDDLVGFLRGGLKVPGLDFFRTEQMSVFRLGYSLFNVAKFIVDAHLVKSFYSVKLGNLRYPRLSWLLDEFERSITDLQPLKGYKRSMRRDVILRMLNHQELMSKEFYNEVCGLCRMDLSGGKLRAFLGEDIKMRCDDIKC